MPTYEYLCEACGARFEKFQKISEKPSKKCPECGQRKARRLISPGAGLLFKGPGFYATDYRKGPAPSKEGEGGGKSDAKGGSSGEGKKDGGSSGGSEEKASS